jgi:hypothetical protein
MISGLRCQILGRNPAADYRQLWSTYCVPHVVGVGAEWRGCMLLVISCGWAVGMCSSKPNFQL